MIRPAGETDFHQVKRLVRSELLNPLGLKRERFLIAEDRTGNLLGCVQIKRHIGGSRELASLVVDPAWRVRGVARQLIEAVKERSRPPLWLTCRSRLTPFYARFGFREIRVFAAMPVYFKLAYAFGRLMHFLGRIEGYIAVMCWDGPDLSTTDFQGV